jgi:dihydrofolate synthase/folylpolyglutamate synthase
MRFATLEEWLAWQETLHPKTIDLGLTRVQKVYQALGGWSEVPFTITVGGTNGKGSCVALLDAMLRAEGYRVGVYTSPHLLRYNERIRIDGQPVDDGPICDAFERIDRVRQDTSLSYFEFGTLAALDIFGKAGLDVQILEVGLGGRLDAVNLIDTNAALIASIDIDHVDWLGSTRESVGREKAGILRSGRPAVVGDLDPPKSLLAYAKQRDIVLARAGCDFDFEKSATSWQWRSGRFTLCDLPFPALQGEHQFLNASAVLQLLRAIENERPVSRASIEKGLRSVSLAGRFQYLPGDTPVFLDVAHNPQAVRILAAHLRRHFAGKRIVAVFAIMRDKDILGVIGGISDVVAAWYLAPLEIGRAASTAELLPLFERLSVSQVMHGFPDAAATFAAARKNARENDLIVVFGSFYLVAEYLAAAI